jgi:hypothetical protein
VWTRHQVLGTVEEGAMTRGASPPHKCMFELTVVSALLSSNTHTHTHAHTHTHTHTHHLS